MPGCSFKAGTYAAAALWLEGSKVEYAPNPKHKDTKSYKRYEAYMKAATIGEALELGSLPDDLLYDYERGFLAVLGPLREAPLDIFSVKDFDELTYTDKALAKYASVASTDGEQNPDQKLFVSKLDESLRKHKANQRRLAKIEKAKELAVDVEMLADDTGAYENETMAARRTIANQQAEEMLEVIASEGRTITDYELLQVLRLWDFRENTVRQNVMREGMPFVYSDTLGLVCNYTGGIVVKEECRRYPNFAKLLNRWFHDNCPKDLGAEFVYTSININKNYAGKLHRDKSNLGPSFLKSFGEFTGGELNYFAEDDRSCNLETIQEKHAAQSVQVDVSKGLLLFDGRRGHSVSDFEGERYSLVFFTCPRFERISDEGKTYFDAAGFRLPSQDSSNKLATVLRKPRGYEDSNGREHESPAKNEHSSIHDAGFLFYPHARPDRDDNEVRAEKYWKAKGLRSFLEAKPEGKPESRIKDKDPAHWYLSCGFDLPSEPARKELILEGQRTKADAIVFLNKPDSEVPQVVQETGCCAVFAVKYKKWHAFYRYGLKEEAMEIFGLQTKEQALEIRLGKGAGRRKKVTKNDHEEDKENRTMGQKGKVAESGNKSQEAHVTEDAIADDQSGRTTPQKRKIVETETNPSTKKQSRMDDVAKIPGAGASTISNFFRKAFQEPPMEPGAASPPSFKAGDAIQIDQPTRALNNVDLLLGQRGSIVQIDESGDAVIHFYDYREALQWVSKKELVKLTLLPRPPLVPKPCVKEQSSGSSSNSKVMSTPHQKRRPIKKDDAPSKKACASTGADSSKEETPIVSKPGVEVVQQSASSSSNSKASSMETVTLDDASSKTVSAKAVADTSKEATPQKGKCSRLEALEALGICGGNACIEFTPNVEKEEFRNPRSYHKYFLYAKAKTLQEAVDMEASHSDISYAYEHGLLKIVSSGDRGSSTRFDTIAHGWRQEAEKERERISGMHID